MSPDSDSVPPEEALPLTRREFLLGSAGGVALMTLGGGTFVTGNGQVSQDPWTHDRLNPVATPPTNVTRHWLAPSLWGNRLQDWRLNGGRIECLRGEAGFEVRTVGLLTRQIVSRNAPGHIRAVTGLLDGAGQGGFCGFLIGIGGGNLDYRAAALAQRASGVGGGMLCTYGTGGQVRFREHTDEQRPLQFADLPSQKRTGSGRQPAKDDRIRLALDIIPRGQGRYDVQLHAFDDKNGRLLAGAIRRGVPERELLGGIALVSSPPPGGSGSRWWFRNVRTAGSKIATHPDRTFGPIAGTLYSLDGNVLKLSAQLMPIGDRAPRLVGLQRRPAGTTGQWRTVAHANVGDGYCAQFRVENWDSTRDWEYRVVYRDGGGSRWYYRGRINANPGRRRELRIALLSCTIAAIRSFDPGANERRNLPDMTTPGRYTPRNIYVPYGTLTRNIRGHDPDLLVFVGDQLYEASPTRIADHREPGLDYLYKWLLWLWSFRNLTRDTPTIVLVDDHDVYQHNLWGIGGHGTLRAGTGGYTGRPEFVNRVQRMQCGHNPDPYDPTPAARGISVYYGAFKYGGVDFAMLEDRKFKSAPMAVHPAERPRSLLGDRQLTFLREWAQERTAGRPRICLTQTTFASSLTDSEGRAVADDDTNGYPRPARARAIRTLRDAGALVLSGDQHLATLLRHGVDGFTDGVVQFNGPAGGAGYARWFQPARALPDGTGHPHTGRFTDGFGNKFRMLAVANPRISFKEFRRHYDRGQWIMNRELRREGYGLVRVRHDREEFVIECWPWNVDPTAPNAEQYRGWPYRLPFDRADGRQR